MSINKVLYELIKKYNLNALELEKMTGVPSSTIYRLLKDKGGNPTIEVLKKLSSFFQVTVSQLIGEEPIGCKRLPLIPISEIINFSHLCATDKMHYSTIPIEFPVNNNCFATTCYDTLMEPFILMNSIIIVDPERDETNKDFVLVAENGEYLPKIRQIITDGQDRYLKVLNTSLNFEMVRINNTNYKILGVIVHYRINLFDIASADKSIEPPKKLKDIKV